MVSLIPSGPVSEKSAVLSLSPELGKRLTPTSNDSFDSSGSPVVFNIRLRNVCLEILYKLISMPPPLQHGINIQ